jgi:DNA segregation ATPase FtsK/SpoIIIE, S-DNA-T family
MAKRKARPKPRSGANSNLNLGVLFRSETIGTALVVLALLTLLSLITARRSTGIGVFVSSLQTLFGVGVWLVPVVFGALGFYLVLRQISDQQVLSSRRIAGLLILFLVFEGMAHLLLAGAEWEPWVPEKVQAEGGAVGWLIAQLLVPILDVPVTLAVLFILGLVGIYVFSGLSLADIQDGLRSFGGWLHGDQRDAAGLPLSPTLNPPLPWSERVPVWQRWWLRLFPPRAPDPLPPPQLGPLPSRQPAGRVAGGPPPTATVVGAGAAVAGAASGGASREPAPPARNVGPATTAASAGLRDAPRIIGSAGQSWRLPALNEILEDSTDQDIQSEDLRQRAQIIERTLDGFGVPVSVVEANQGPAVTQFGLRPGIIVRKNRKGEEKRVKVRVSQIQALANDLSLALAASPLRIEAPVPGRDVVGIEVPNVQISLVSLRGVMESEEFRASHGSLLFGLGRDVSGQAAVADLARMPHMLIAGATGSGKSVCVNAIITTLLLTHTPDTLRFLMVDPKRVELTVYNGIPHLIAPVVVDVERAVPVLQWATKEMERRYKLFAKVGARNIETYNEKQAERGEQTLPFIVILIDELADLMLSAPEEVERYICRLAQMARATGMHLVIATQRPSVDVVTGLIKANFPARIAFAVTSLVDSRVILDTPGAEQLLGRGDMLFMAPDASKLQRLQGCFVSDRETGRLVRYWKGIRSLEGGEPAPMELPIEGAPSEPDLDAVAAPEALAATPNRGGPELPWLPGQEALQQPLWDDLAAQAGEGSGDDMYRQAVEEVRRTGRASVSLLQRRLRIGYSRAARLIDELEANGVIGPDQGGSRGREVLPGNADAE